LQTPKTASGGRARRVGVSGLVCVVLLSLLFWAGPRVEMTTTLRPLELPQDLDRYLAQTEAACGGIVPGTEKRIDWFSGPGVQTPLAVVYVHGFSASRQDTAPLAALIAERLQANLFATRLTGHGGGSRAMLDGSVNAWVNDVHEAVEIGKRLGQRVVLVGSSTGASLATWQTARGVSSDIAALVLLSPNFGLADRRTVLLTWPWGAQLAELLAGKTRHLQPVNEAFARYWTTSYPVRALLPMMGVVRLARSLDLRQVSTPTLVIYSPGDRVLDTRAILAAYHELGAETKRLVPFGEAGDPDQHILAGEVTSPASTATLARLVTDFLAAVPHVFEAAAAPDARSDRGRSGGKKHREGRLEPHIARSGTPGDDRD